MQAHHGGGGNRLRMGQLAGLAGVADVSQRIRYRRFCPVMDTGALADVCHHAQCVIALVASKVVDGNAAGRGVRAVVILGRDATWRC